MAMYDLPGCSRDSEFFESDVSTVSALTVCFCCLASDTPVINAITCTHTEFVQQYFAEWNNQKLAICHTCHFMLKKIEVFRRQVRESLDLLSDYQHTKEHNLNRPRLVNNLVTTDLVVTSNVTSTERSNDDVQKIAKDVVPIEIDVDEEPGTSKDDGENSDDETTEKIEIASNLLEPASVVLKKPGIQKKRRKKGKGKKPFTHIKHRTNPRRWWPKTKTFEAAFLPESSMLSINHCPPTNSRTKKSVTTEKDVSPSNFVTEKSITVKKIGSTTISLKKKTINSLKNGPPTKESTTTGKKASPSKFLTEKSKTTKNIGSTTISLTKKSMKAKTNVSPTDTPAKINKSTYWLAQELARLRREPLALKLAKLRGEEMPPKRIQNRPNKIQQTEKQPPNVQIFSTKVYFDKPLDEKYNGKIKVTYLTQDELMRERETEKQKESYLKRPYKCETCIQGFVDKVRYKTHVSKNHPSDRTDYETSCEVCDTIIKTSRGIQGHLKYHVQRYVCVSCGKTSRMLEHIEAHYKLAHAEKSIKCKDCNKTFGKRKNMLLHRRQEHKKECIYCKRGFLTIPDLQHHYRKMHPDESPFKCEHCTDSFRHIYDLYRHRTFVHNIRTRRWKRNNDIDNKDENIIVIDDNEYEFEGTENTENTGHDNSREMENNSGEDCIDIVKDEHNVIELENIEHISIVGLVNNDHNIVELVNNKPNIVGMVNNDHNIVGLVNNDHNIVGLANNEHNIVEFVDNDHNIVGLVNNGHNIVEFVDNDHNIVGLVNNEHNIVEFVDNDHNIVGMEIIEPNIAGMEDIEPKIVESENIEHNIVEMENNEPNIVESVNNEHQDDMMGENDLNNMDQDIEYNSLEEKEDQSCIIGL